MDASSKAKGDTDAVPVLTPDNVMKAVTTARAALVNGSLGKDAGAMLKPFQPLDGKQPTSRFARKPSVGA